MFVYVLKFARFLKVCQQKYFGYTCIWLLRLWSSIVQVVSFCFYEHQTITWTNINSLWARSFGKHYRKFSECVCIITSLLKRNFYFSGNTRCWGVCGHTSDLYSGRTVHPRPQPHHTDGRFPRQPGCYQDANQGQCQGHWDRKLKKTKKLTM